MKISEAKKSNGLLDCSETARSRRNLAALAVVVCLLPAIAAAQQATAIAGDFNPRSYRVPTGTDIALTGRAGWNTLPVAFSRGDGRFQMTNHFIGNFAAWAAQPGVVKLAGDFNGDNLVDVALAGGAGWSDIPLAFSQGNGSFLVGTTTTWTFAQDAAVTDAAKLALDANGDRRTDLVVLGGNPFKFSILSSEPNGNYSDYSYFGWVNNWLAAYPPSRKMTGDFDGDGWEDIVLSCFTNRTGLVVLYALPLSPYSSVIFYPVFYDHGPGTYPWSQQPQQDNLDFASWACAPGVEQHVADFNDDGRADIALTGGPGWQTMPVAFSNGHLGLDAYGYLVAVPFTVTNDGVDDFAEVASDPGVESVLGDFDGDGLPDVALPGAPGSRLWIASSNGDGSFRVTAEPIGSFAGWARGTGVRRLVGDYDNDGHSDIALTGGVGWNTLPVAFSNGDGTFRVTNQGIGAFAALAAP